MYQKINSFETMNGFKEMFPLPRMFPLAVMHGGVNLTLQHRKTNLIKAHTN